MTQSDAKSFSKLLKEDKEEVACHCNGLECPPDTARVNSEFLKPGKKQTKNKVKLFVLLECCPFYLDSRITRVLQKYYWAMPNIFSCYLYNLRCTVL
jgi:hypothetical protein